MASFFGELWESIFTPGPTPTLLVATNVTFAVLQVLLAALFFATLSAHFAALSFISGGLWWSINWFSRELMTHQAQQGPDHQWAALDAAAATLEDSETEVEEARPKPIKSAGRAAVEAVEQLGELKHRAAGDSGSQGTKSGMTTEDEWEKVSENEDGKDH